MGMAVDRSAEVYLGDYGGAWQRDKLVRRIDWAVEQCIGTRALDVGCSQGMLAILLARKLISVTGVDIDGAALSFARTLFESEPAPVQSKAELIELDLCDYEPAITGFDTVFICEVIEHLERPAEAVEKCVKCLGDAGRLVLTVPHGHLPHEDHYWEFGFSDVLNFLPSCMAINSLSSIDGYIRLVATKTSLETNPRPTGLELETLTTQALRDQQRYFQKLLKQKSRSVAEIQASLSEAEKKLCSEKERASSVSDELMSIQSELKSEKMRASSISDELLSVHSELKSEKARVSSSSDELLSVHSELKSAKARVSSISGELLSVKSELEAEKESATAVLEQLSAAQERLKREEEAGRSLNIEIAEKESERKALYRRQKRFINKLKQQIKSKNAELTDLRKSKRFRVGNILANFTRRPGRTFLYLVKTKLFPKRASKQKELPAPSQHRTKLYQFSRYVPEKRARKESEAVKTKVAVILDDFSAECLRHCWDVTFLSRKNWKAEIEAAKPAMLFVESAWRGNKGGWSYTLTSNGAKNRGDVEALLAFCRECGVPTVFWNKEDPPNFEVFKDAAVLFDHIFTTDASCVKKYKKLARHDNVYALPFAAEPSLHNPLARQALRGKSVAFAGGWYGEKHSARARLLPMLLDGALKAVGDQLVIFDRFSDDEGSDKHRFPAAYHQLIHPKIPYEEMLSAYRSFDVFLNVNSVVDSETMFSRRVFELLACATNVVSSPSKAMAEMLPDVVATVENEGEAKEAIRHLLESEQTRAKTAHLGYRLVQTRHTYSHRVREVESRVIGVSPNTPLRPLITVIAPTNRPERLANLKNSFMTQSYANKQLLLVLNSGGFNRSEVEKTFSDVPNCSIFQISEDYNLPKCLNLVLPHVEGEYWAKMDDDDVYGPEYLSDSIIPFQFTNASIIGKATYFAQVDGDDTIYERRANKSHQYTPLICGGTIMARTSDTATLRFDEKKSRGSDTQYLKDARAAGLQIYSADPFNFIQKRSGNAQEHTWQIEQTEYLKHASPYSSRQRIEEIIF